MFNLPVFLNGAIMAIALIFLLAFLNISETWQCYANLWPILIPNNSTVNDIYIRFFYIYFGFLISTNY